MGSGISTTNPDLLLSSYLEAWTNEGQLYFKGSDTSTLDEKKRFHSSLDRLKVVHRTCLQDWMQSGKQSGLTGVALDDDVMTRLEAMIIQERSLLDEMSQPKSKILLVSLDGSTLKIKGYIYTAMKEKASDVKVLSYRWNESAVEFSKQFSWADAFNGLARTGEYSVPPPTNESGSNFYTSLVKIIQRTGIKFLWVDQLCIPQNMAPFSIKISQALGCLYREFEVIVWVPWIVKSNEELETYKSEIQSAEDGEDDTYIINVLGKDISSLFHQSLRGWILREMSPSCTAMESEYKRNEEFLGFICWDILGETIERHLRNDTTNTVEGREITKIYSMAEQTYQTLYNMTGYKNPRRDALIELAAKVTVAPFTVPSDRAVVATLDSYVSAVTVVTVAGNSTVNVMSKDYSMLRMFMYLGCRLPEKGKMYMDWPGYDFDQQTCKQVISYFLTIGQSNVCFTEEQFKRLDTLLRSGQFVAYLPAEHSKLLDSAAPPDGYSCYIIVTSGDCGLMYASAVGEGKVKARYGVEGVVVEAAGIQAGNVQQLLDVLASENPACFVGGSLQS